MALKRSGAPRTMLEHKTPESNKSVLLYIGQQMKYHLSTTLNHAQDRRLFFLHRTPTGFAFASAPTAFALFALDYLRLSLMTGYHIGFIALHLVGEDHGWLFFTMPPRSSVVI